MDAILEIAHRHQLIVIEDAAHAVGTRYQGQNVGSIGHLTNFSFYPNKNMTTIEGGMITTDNDEWDELLRIYRIHGLSRDAWKRFGTKRLMMSNATVAGYKYNMTDVQAALGIHQLTRAGTIFDHCVKSTPVCLTRRLRPCAVLNYNLAPPSPATAMPCIFMYSFWIWNNLLSGVMRS